MCDADNGDVAAVEARGYRCTSCGAWPNSTWWYRAERRREVEVSQVDRYRIRRRLRATELATEHDAERIETGRRVVLRLYHGWLAENPAFVDQFARASALRGGFDSEHLVPVDGAGRSEEGFFVALQPFGEPVLAAMRGQRFDVGDVVELVSTLCGVYAAAHQQGLLLGVHPEAIFVRRPDEGDPYRSNAVAHARFVALDLFAHALTRPWRMSEAETGVRIGGDRTLEYMAPEQLMGKELDPRTDIYALGVLTYELLASRKPFPDANGPAGLITAQIKRTPQPVSELVAGVSPAFEAVVSRCLEKDRRARFADASALAAALEPLRAN